MLWMLAANFDAHGPDPPQVARDLYRPMRRRRRLQRHWQPAANNRRLNLAIKAFHPAKVPFPVLHVDTTWKFREMIAFRDVTMLRLGLELIVHINPEGVSSGIGPISHGSALHTDIMKTQGLRQALAKGQFDAAIGGARRDEEKSRAKERIFSHRTTDHRWDPKNQRPELWQTYNGRVAAGETMRIYPLSNWTELDVWEYIEAKDIDVVPLYFAAARP